MLLKSYRRITRLFRKRGKLDLNGEVFDYCPCLYCGVPADSVDHFIPRAYADSLSELTGVSNRLLNIVPACRECNSMAGAKVFMSVSEKRHYIHDCLRKKYQKVLTIPLWTEHDYSNISKNLGGYIKRNVSLQDIIRWRLRWPHKENSAN